MTQKPDILIAEESPHEAEKLKRVLEQHNHEVSVAHNGELALASIRQRKPKIVISDTQLPTLNGFELCRQIKADENLQGTFVILLTTLSDPRDVIRGLECGADNFIAKGSDEKLLLSRIENIVLNHPAQQIKEQRTPLEILLGGKSYFITPDSQRMATLLIWTYEGAVQKNFEYLSVQEELKFVNERLENEVQERTAELRTEISNHRAVAEALSVSEERYYQLLENSPETIALHCEGLLVYVNPAGTKLLSAATSDELIGKPIMSFVHSADHESGLTSTRKSDQGEPVAFSEKRLVRLDGQVIDVEVINTPTTYKGKPAGQLIIRDVTERKLAEKAKQESQQQYESLVNSLDGIVWELDARTFRFTFVSKQAERLLGYPREQWTTDPNFWTDRLHPDDKWAVNTCIESIADRKDHQLEYRLIAADGRVVWLKDIVTVERLDGENPRVRGVMFDITASKLVEEEKTQLVAQIERHRQRLDAILTNLPSVIWESWNEPLANGRPLNFVSDYVETMLGYSVGEWVSTPNFWLSIVHPEDRERIAEAFDSKLDAGTSRALEFRWLAKNGRVIWVEAQAMVMRDLVGKKVGFRGVGLDITELKRAERALMESEDRLRQSQKMEAIGTLAGGVAHDFNNLLTAILGNTQLAMRKLQTAGSPEVHLVEVEKAGNRAATLTRQLLAFSRRQHLERRTINVNEIILEIMRLLKRIIGADVEVEVKCADDLPTVFADPAQIEQVIMNLGANARDAMPQGGKLTIETNTLELDETYCRDYPYVRPGPYVQIIVSDTGEGMDEETRARVFEPFFTTKEIGKGTGLGLSMVYGIVKQHHGHINVYSELGQGTTFKVFLPVNTTAAEKETQAVQHPVLGGPETILVAEDEEALRTLASDILKSLGYTVLLASNGKEAVQIYAENRDRIDIVLLDVVMPVMSGSEAYKRIREMGGDVPLLIMTGHSSEMVQSRLFKPNDSLGELGS
jgi:two-component system cell cycle sensor histidine kinase/response regulator CckA